VAQSRAETLAQRRREGEDGEQEETAGEAGPCRRARLRLREGVVKSVRGAAPPLAQAAALLLNVGPSATVVEHGGGETSWREE
jgi:hypothetical protein